MPGSAFWVSGWCVPEWRRGGPEGAAGAGTVRLPFGSAQERRGRATAYCGTVRVCWRTAAVCCGTAAAYCGTAKVYCGTAKVYCGTIKFEFINAKVCCSISKSKCDILRFEHNKSPRLSGFFTISIESDYGIDSVNVKLLSTTTRFLTNYSYK
jgi:hypothetical protein